MPVWRLLQDDVRLSRCCASGIRLQDQREARISLDDSQCEAQPGREAPVAGAHKVLDRVCKLRYEIDDIAKLSALFVYRAMLMGGLVDVDEPVDCQDGA